MPKPGEKELQRRALNEADIKRREENRRALDEKRAAADKARKAKEAKP
jgi:hypothetical protein